MSSSDGFLNIRRPWFIEESGKPVPLHFLHLALGRVDDVGKLVTDLTSEVDGVDCYICAHSDAHKDTLLVLGKKERWDKARRNRMINILETQFGQKSITPLRVTMGVHPLAERAQDLWLEYLTAPTYHQASMYIDRSQRSRAQACFQRGADGWRDDVGEQTWDNAAFYIEDLRLLAYHSTHPDLYTKRVELDRDLDWAALH